MFALSFLGSSYSFFWKAIGGARQALVAVILSIIALPSLAGPIYNGGPVMTGTSDVYYLWYGDWSVDTKANSILNTLVKDLNGSSYFNINSTYDTGTSNVSTTLNMAGNVDINSTTNSNLYLGSTLDGTNFNTFSSIVQKAISGGVFGSTTADPNGIYYVLTSSTVSVNGFNTSFCGWHSSTNWGNSGGLGTQFGFIGDPTLNSGCNAPIQDSGITDFGADAMASTIAHELSETVTDPTGEAWWDSNKNSSTYQNENADMCAWTFGTTYSVSGGGNANVTLNGNNYLLQQNWINTGNGGGKCALSYGAPAGGGNQLPEPTSMSLIGLGSLALVAARRRRHKI